MKITYPLWTRLVASRNLGFRSIKAPIGRLVVPNQIRPELFGFVAFNGIDCLDERIPGVLIGWWGFPVIVADFREAGWGFWGVVTANIGLFTFAAFFWFWCVGGAVVAEGLTATFFGDFVGDGGFATDFLPI